MHCLGSVFVRPNLLHIHPKVLIKERRESILLQYTTMYHPFTEISDLFNVIDVLRFHSLRAAGLVVFAHRGGMKEKNAWCTLLAHAFNFRKISENRIFQ